MRIVFGSMMCLLLVAGKATPQAADSIKVPFVLTGSGHFIVEVKINDKGPYKLIFDTGAPTMLITNRIAQDSGVVDKKKGGGGSLFSPFGAMAQSKAKQFSIGDLKADDVGMMVFDHPTVKAFSDHYKKEHGSIDGIVGFPLFARYKMVVDYQAKELTMTPNGYKPADVMESMMKMMMGGKENQGKPKIAGANGHWGLVVDKDAKDEEEGVDIKVVMPDSPAEKAGLKPGDRLLTIDGRWTDSIGDTYQAAGAVKANKAAAVTFKRAGKAMELKMTPASGL